MKKSNKRKIILTFLIMIPLVKRMMGRSRPPGDDKPNKPLKVMNPPSAPDAPKVATDFRLRADLDLTVKALYPLTKANVWEALYDWVDSSPGEISSRPLLTLLLMWTVSQAEQVGANVWKSTPSFVLGYNDQVNPVNSLQQFTWSPIVGTGRSRVSVQVKFQVKPSRRQGIPAFYLWEQLMKDEDAVKFAAEVGLSVSNMSEVSYNDSN